MNQFFYRYFFCAVMAVLFFTGCQSQSGESKLLNPTSAEAVISLEEESGAETSANEAQASQRTDETKEGPEERKASSEQRLIGVYVHGAVKNPGVYYLPEQSRVCDAVFLAGGFTKNAARTARNQAEFLADGEDLWILTKKEYQKQKKLSRKGNMEDSSVAEEGKEHGSSSCDVLVNINTATKEELMTLPGVGESKAEAILAFREEHGSFSKIEDIMQVPGVKEGVFAGMKDDITV